jgi:hypothetical protein
MHFKSLSISCKQIVNSLNKSCSSSINSLQAVNQFAYVSCTRSKPLVSILSILRARNYISAYSTHSRHLFSLSPNIFYVNFLFRLTDLTKARISYDAFHFSDEFISAKKFKKLYALNKISRNAICVTPTGIFYAADVYRSGQSVRILINPNF